MKLLKSFVYALNGIWNGIINEMNFRIHTVAAVSVAMFARVYGVSRTEAALLALVICLVMAMELVNTTAEAMVDLMGTEKSHMAQLAKDSAAAAVLVLAVGAVVIAVFIFSDTGKLKTVLNFAIDNALFFIIYIIACIFYIFGIKPGKQKKMR